MKRVRFTKEQIIAVLREHEAGAKTGDLARKHGISEATLYNWKAKYGGMADRKPSGCDPGRREPQAEEAAGDIDARHAALKNLLAKNVWSAPALQGLSSCCQKRLA